MKMGGQGKKSRRYLWLLAVSVALTGWTGNEAGADVRENGAGTSSRRLFGSRRGVRLAGGKYRIHA